ncbi:hypothetical protein JG687_00010303 [Phytophthora cactorum]|uniref:RxLR effector protein n=1 Tax=Phytophthora cactorum TaxID=29920 RepID=A0A8T1U7N0_9STRA|nr:hypothetical protein PC120_g9707 [Phytophthora cactorum]KAG3190358.1 hypothetical protein PC128_g11372 [Phytophthora cactorum]KAG4049457.1 hypothetical protein PC123_g15256 [Phytophthora cactorum]KAG6956923.1 hypothetical protein JG687_00010303 [Phytophthora cactorum]
MRLTYFKCILLFAAVALLTSLSIEADAETRSLRALKTVNGGDAAEEERGAFLHTFNFNAWDEIFFFFNKMPEQFQRMRTEPEYLRYILASWYTGLQDMDQVVAFMTKTNLSKKAIEEFKNAYLAYIAHVKAAGTAIIR